MNSMRNNLIAAALVAAVGTTGIALASGSGGSHHPSATASASKNPLASKAAQARLATAKYATNLARAKHDGYGIITQMIPNMGSHFLNPAVKTFDVRRPMILVYERRGSTYTLGALEWVFPAKPAKPPLP